MNNWYVYKHIRSDKNEPFYIGIGCKKDFGRAYEFTKSKRNTIWYNIYNKTSITVEVLFENLNKQEASLKEQELISIYGRIDLNTGTLANMTDGGDGIWNCKRSDECKYKLRESKLGDKNPMYGKIQSTELVEKRMKNIRGSKRSDIIKRKASLNSKQSKITIVCDINNNFIGQYHSLAEACRILNVSSSKACLVIKGIRKHTKNYVFSYLL